MKTLFAFLVVGFSLAFLFFLVFGIVLKLSKKNELYSLKAKKYLKKSFLCLGISFISFLSFGIIYDNGEAGKIEVIKLFLSLAFIFLFYKYVIKKLFLKIKEINLSYDIMPNDEYVVIHTDTTGLYPDIDEILKITALRVINGKITDTFSSLVKPFYMIDEKITKINGITDEMVETAPNIEDVLISFQSFLKDNDVLVGYNVNFYNNFLKYHFNNSLSIKFNHTLIDAMNLSVYILKSKSKKMFDIAKILKIDINSFDPMMKNAYICFEIFEHFRNKVISKKGKWNVYFLTKSKSLILKK